jgi:Colicin D
MVAAAGRLIGLSSGSQEGLETAAEIGQMVVLGIGFRRPQLQHAFKHAGDFGVVGNANDKTLAEFSTAIHNHVTAPSTQTIQGTYRGQADNWEAADERCVYRLWAAAE